MAITLSSVKCFAPVTMPRLSDVNPERAIGRLQAWESATDVATAFGVSLSTICRLRTRFQATGSTRDAPSTGRPRVTSARQDRALLLNHLRNSFLSAVETARNTIGNHGRAITGQTVRHRLREGRLECRRSILTLRHRQNRVAWAQQHLNWTWRQWRNVIFTDESRFCISRGDGRIQIWRRTNQRFADNNVLQVNAWGGPSIMIWCGIGLNQHLGPIVFQNIGPGRGNGVTAQRYIQQVLAPTVIPHFQQHPNRILQQDNARPHAARVTAAFLQQNNIRVLPWPAMSLT